MPRIEHLNLQNIGYICKLKEKQRNPGTNMSNTLVLFLAAINLLSLTIYGLDKRKAIRGRQRIPETTLLLMAVIGGSIGALIGMIAFRHKTKKLKFTIGVPIILIAHVYLFAMLD